MHREAKRAPCVEHGHEREIFLGTQCLTSNNFDLQMGHTKPAAQFTSLCLGAAGEEVFPWFSRESEAGFVLQALQ